MSEDNIPMLYNFLEKSVDKMSVITFLSFKSNRFILEKDMNHQLYYFLLKIVFL